MNNQQSFARQRENSQAVLKSQKALNSVAVLHLRTETQESVESRSPELRTELRQTWRRPRMPYNRLPDAFQMREKRKKSNKELLVNLDRIVKINQYKEIQKLLEPIAPSRPHDAPRPTHGNPLATIHKFFRIETRFRQQLADQPSLIKHKAFSYKSQPTALRLNECITLGVIKRGNHTGTLKKVLHVPTFRLLCVREEPLSNRQQRAAAKGWLEFWQSRLNSLPHFLPLHTLLFNVPEGALSIATDHLPNGSLRDLLDSVFTLPESVIRQVFSGVCASLGEFYAVGDHQFSQLGGLSPSQILFSSKGKPRIGLGLFYRINNRSTSFYNLRATPQKLDLNTSQHSFLTPSVPNAQVDRSLDVFKLGVMMLECAIGGLEGFEQTPLLLEAIRNSISQQGQAALERDNVCCLIHSQGYLLERAGTQDERSRRDRVDLSATTPYARHLKQRFSAPFVSFLCSALRLVHARRASLKELLGHPFLASENDKDTKTAQICLNDLLAINNGWNQQTVQSMGEEQGEKLLGHILHVFHDLSRHVTADLVSNHRDKILSLSSMIGINSKTLGERLLQALQQFAHPKRDFNTSI